MICDCCELSVAKLVESPDPEFQRVCPDCNEMLVEQIKVKYPTDECTECCSWALPGDTKCMYHKYNENK